MQAAEVADQLVGTVVAAVACVINHHAPDHAISSGKMNNAGL
jgi:hypothetical protein